jgi:fluoride exporter
VKVPVRTPPIPGRGHHLCYERGVRLRGVQVFDRSEPFSVLVLAAVAVGGAIGAGGRWFVAWALDAIGEAHQPGTWSWATLIVNVVGAGLIGLAARAYARADVTWAFAVTGVLGGFTTFSTFAVELNDMADAGRLPLAVVYASVTVAGGVAAAALAGNGDLDGDTG